MARVHNYQPRLVMETNIPVAALRNQLGPSFERIAAADDTTMNQLFVVAIAELLAVWRLLTITFTWPGLR